MPVIRQHSNLLRLAAFISLVSTPLVSAAGGGFDKELSLQGLTFHVTCPNEGSINHVQIDAKGLTEVSAPVKVEVDGTVTGAEVADLNADGSPEIYIFTQSAGSGSYGNVIAYAANKKKSLSQVTLPDLLQNKQAAKGYMGHDEFAVVENRLVRRFKLYEVTDANSKPTGKTRRISYRLEAGEAGWILRETPFTDI
ncbi:MAG: PliI family lysozyme inhibitor of I-type lysozyme [Verrucomicrobia bacterium]|nr:PliI family lysozyme inhibitor of I-type lysozyme [Verrucomicrobiota bacterium]